MGQVQVRMVCGALVSGGIAWTPYISRLVHACLAGSCGGNICAGALRFSSSVYTHFWLFFAHLHRRTLLATPNMVPSLSMCRPFGSPGKQSKVAFVMSSAFLNGILIESPTRAHIGSSLLFKPMRRMFNLVRHISFYTERVETSMEPVEKGAQTGALVTCNTRKNEQNRSWRHFVGKQQSLHHS